MQQTKDADRVYRATNQRRDRVYRAGNQKKRGNSYDCKNLYARDLLWGDDCDWSVL